MKKLVSIIFLLTILLSSDFSLAQLKTLTIGVDGFTCSLCAKGVEGQFKELDFVKSVKTDLKNTLFVLTFKSAPQVNISQIRDAVNDGGFSVRDIKVEANGTIKGNSESGYLLITTNAPEINLKDVTVKLNDGQKVSLKGIVGSDINSISVTSIKKL